MASEEERAKILADYMQAADADDGQDEEEEFHGDDDSDIDGEEGSYGDSDDDDGDDDDALVSSKDENYAVLQGNLVLNDEGRLVYSGIWCMKKDLNKQQQQGDEKKAIVEDGKKKKTKFKLKSKQTLGSESQQPFSLLNPLLGDNKPRSLLFDGFFTTDETDTIQPYRKIKERDVELIFSLAAADKSDGTADTATANGNSDDKGKEKEKSTTEGSKKIVVKGKGNNDFGQFHLGGIYGPADGSHSLTCSKRYGVAEASASAGTKRGRGYNDDSEDDYVMSDDEGANLTELVGLHDDAELSVDELRKRYYGGDDSGAGSGSGAGAGGGNKSGTDSAKNGEGPAKRSKIAEEDDDDGCGF
eukprot:274386_1